MTTTIRPPSAEQIADLAKAWRAREGLTQTAAAENLGLPTRTYQHIEQGRGFRYPTFFKTMLKQVTFKAKK